MTPLDKPLESRSLSDIILVDAMNNVYGLIFDVDGVIADTERVNAEVIIKVFADLFGLRDVQRKDFEAGLGRGAIEYVKAKMYKEE